MRSNAANAAMLDLLEPQVLPPCDQIDENCNVSYTNWAEVLLDTPSSVISTSPPPLPFSMVREDLDAGPETREISQVKLIAPNQQDPDDMEAVAQIEPTLELERGLSNAGTEAQSDSLAVLCWH